MGKAIVSGWMYCKLLGTKRFDVLFFKITEYVRIRGISSSPLCMQGDGKNRKNGTRELYC